MTLQQLQDLLYVSKRIELVHTNVIFYLPKDWASRNEELGIDFPLLGDPFLSINYCRLIALLFNCITHGSNFQYARNKNKPDEFIDVKPLNFPF